MELPGWVSWPLFGNNNNSMSRFPTQLPRGWYPASAHDEKRLMDELQKEVIPGHLLYGLRVRVIAHRDGATDDILVAHQDQPQRYTVVHLTWKGGPEINKDHPFIECDGDYAAFIEYEGKWSDEV